MAKTFDDLTTLTTDLVPLQALPVHTNPTGRQLVVSDGANSEADTMSTVMSSVKREGTWRVRAHSVANNVMGDIKLDLTQATFDAPVVEVTGTQLMGSMLLRVPLGSDDRRPGHQRARRHDDQGHRRARSDHADHRVEGHQHHGRHQGAWPQEAVALAPGPNLTA